MFMHSSSLCSSLTLSHSLCSLSSLSPLRPHPGSSSQTRVASSQAPGPSSPAQAASSQGNQAQQMHSVTAAPIMTKFDPTIHMTAVVTLESSHGRKLRARAFLDTGSHLTIMTRRAAQLLQLHLHPEKLGMAGVGDVTTCSSHSSHMPNLYF